MFVMQPPGLIRFVSYNYSVAFKEFYCKNQVDMEGLLERKCSGGVGEEETGAAQGNGGSITWNLQTGT